MAPGSWSRSISGPADPELGVPRTSPVVYHGTEPGRPAQGLVFVIHGFGKDTSTEYDLKLRQHLAGTYGLLAITVEYHCYRCRPDLGAQIAFPPESEVLLLELADRCGIRDELQSADVGSLVDAVGSRLQEPFEIAAQLLPPNGDLQNFGVLQALDHLQVLDHLLREGPSFDRRRIWLFGSSHGGYLAHLIHKFAPNTFTAIVDNSGYTRAHRQFLGLGTEYGITTGKLTLACSVKTPWQFRDVHAPHYFGIPQDLIREISHPPHLAVCRQAGGSRCAIRMTNARVDPISPFAAKSRLDHLYREAGYDSVLIPFGGEGPNPGFANSAEHGDVSLKRLFDHFAPELLRRPLGEGILDHDLGTDLSFDCVECVYRIRHGDRPAVQVTIQPR